MTGVKWQGAIIVSSWWKHPSQLHIWSRCGLSAWAQRSHSVTRVLLCGRTNAQAKNIQCQVTIWMFYFSSKTVSAKLGCRGWGGGSPSFSHKGAGPFSVHPLQEKKNGNTGATTFFWRRKMEKISTTHQTTDVQFKNTRYPAHTVSCRVIQIWDGHTVLSEMKMISSIQLQQSSLLTPFKLSLGQQIQKAWSTVLITSWKKPTQ